MEGEEGSQQPQLVLADKEVVKRKKNMEEEEEVVKRMKIMEGEGSQQPQLVLADKDDHLIRLIKTLDAECEQEAIKFQSWLAESREELKKQKEKALGRPLSTLRDLHEFFW